MSVGRDGAGGVVVAGAEGHDHLHRRSDGGDRGVECGQTPGGSACSLWAGTTTAMSVMAEPPREVVWRP
ncbi:hypothetical protein [Gordonia namibiensis]|uniref:hypothetical protein n=1 Tax=Gordonia namibiensis TaxID=168480 RepID=UPI001427E269|nr:hypothetical protein [Gordonia namibiensis]